MRRNGKILLFYGTFLLFFYSRGKVTHSPTSPHLYSPLLAPPNFSPCYSPLFFSIFCNSVCIYTSIYLYIFICIVYIILFQTRLNFQQFKNIPQEINHYIYSIILLYYTITIIYYIVVSNILKIAKLPITTIATKKLFFFNTFVYSIYINYYSVIVYIKYTIIIILSYYRA